jgi:trehalose 6-phosphate phosphatase
MKALDRQITYISFLDRLRSAPTRVLLLDYDGTLAPFTVDRSLALPYPRMPALLVRIMARGTRVVLISGRPARELVLLSGIHPHPEIWGSYGLERLKPDDSYEVGTLSRQHQTGLLLAAKALRANGLEPQMEPKPGGIAVHWRGVSAPDAAEIEAKARRLWRPLLGDHSLILIDFDGGMEIRAPGRNKGDAVETILRESGRDAAIAYLGDDTTDEEAFCALRGKGLTVLAGPQSRPTAAEIWLQPPHELLRFFEEWLRASGSEE